MLPLGGQTVRHGVVRIVDTVQSLLHAIGGNRATAGMAVHVIDAVMAGFLSAGRQIARCNGELIEETVRRTLWTGLEIRHEDRADCCDAVLTAFDVFCVDPLLRRAWKNTWLSYTRPTIAGRSIGAPSSVDHGGCMPHRA